MVKYKVVRYLQGHLHDVCGCDFSPDGALLATASYDTSVIVWDPHIGTMLIHLRLVSRYVSRWWYRCHFYCVSVNSSITFMGKFLCDILVSDLRSWKFMFSARKYHVKFSVLLGFLESVVINTILYNGKSCIAP